jgi:hypothetical protein
VKSYNGFSPEVRNQAQAWLNREWKSGRLARPAKCCACGQEHGIIDAHAEDYSEPFCAGKTDEYPLCFRCHMMVHCRFGRGAVAWDAYRENVRAGVMFAAITERNFGRFSAETLRGDRGCSAAWVQREPPTILPLDDIHNARTPQ